MLRGGAPPDPGPAPPGGRLAGAGAQHRPDDIWLSNAYARPTTTVACLQNTSLPYEEYFRDMEAVFRQYGGRPHWGKKHWLTARELRPLYPRWDDFQAVRRRLDPDGVFLTPDLSRLLEEG
ncbi:D-arabinono-1,4-lactone oxidase [Micromonospora sp. NPDC003776]